MTTGEAQDFFRLIEDLQRQIEALGHLVIFLGLAMVGCLLIWGIWRVWPPAKGTAPVLLDPTREDVLFALGMILDHDECEHTDKGEECPEEECPSVRVYWRQP